MDDDAALTPAETAELATRLGRELLAGRKFIIGIGILAGATRQVELIAEHGGRRPLVIARNRGVGPVPTTAQAEIVMLETPATTSMSADLRYEDALLRDLPGPARAAIDAYDPEASALWWTNPHVTGDRVAGRAVFAPRRQAWADWEDKTRCDQLFDAVGIRRAPSRVCPLDAAELRTAGAALDRGAGVVWSGDASRGISGGAEFVRWVRDGRDAAAALELFSSECDRVRVMPFLEGVPCSIHAIVCPDGSAVLRPVEMVVLRRADRTFSYAGMSTWWDPPAAIREQLRAVAARIAAELDSVVGYRGSLSVDGILTVGGFAPTEVNTRFSGGINVIAKGVPDVPVLLLQAALQRGVDIGLGARRLETTLVRAADQHRFGQYLAISNVATTEADCADHELEIGTLSRGPSPLGTIVRLTTERGMVAGQRLAPHAVAGLAVADRLWGTGFGRLTAAPEVEQAAETLTR